MLRNKFACKSKHLSFRYAARIAFLMMFLVYVNLQTV